jgi:hypothetical protein
VEIPVRDLTVAGVVPTNVPGERSKPLLEADIKTAQLYCKSAAACARYLNVAYSTYKKYAVMYGLFENVKNPTGKGMPKRKYKGVFGLDTILAGEHPTYNRGKLKMRLIKAGKLAEECVRCGFNEKRILDGYCPLVLCSKDGDKKNLQLDNLELKCYNCTAVTTGKVGAKNFLSPGVYNDDIMTTGQLSMDEIERIQNELMGE